MDIPIEWSVRDGEASMWLFGPRHGQGRIQASENNGETRSSFSISAQHVEQLASTVDDVVASHVMETTKFDVWTVALDDASERVVFTGPIVQVLSADTTISVDIRHVYLPALARMAKHAVTAVEAEQAQPMSDIPEDVQYEQARDAAVRRQLLAYGRAADWWTSLAKTVSSRNDQMATMQPRKMSAEEWYQDKPVLASVAEAAEAAGQAAEALIRHADHVRCEYERERQKLLADWEYLTGRDPAAVS